MATNDERRRVFDPSVRIRRDGAKLLELDQRGAYRYPMNNPEAGQGRGFGIAAPPLRTGQLDRAVERGTGRSLQGDTPTLPGARATPSAPSAMPPVTVRQNGNQGSVPSMPGMTVAPRRTTLQPGSFRIDQSGPTPAPAVPAKPTATSIAGRDLGYGQMQDGVRVFSDGSGSIPRTMTDQQIAGLASGDRVTTIPAANFARPAPGVAASIASGGQTPALGSLPRRPEAPMFSRQFDPVRAAQMDAAADLEAAMSQDMRSPLGRAARNARVQGQQDTYLQHVRGMAEGGIVGRSNLAQEQVRDAGATQRTGMDIAGRLTEAGMMADAGMAQTLAARRPSIAQVPLADGTLGLLDAETGQMRVATGADGMPARPQLAQRTQTNINSGVARLVQDAVPRLLGLDPVSGKRSDGSTPSPQEIAQAYESAMLQFGAVADEGGAQEPTMEQWMASARQANPGATDDQLMQLWRARAGS